MIKRKMFGLDIIWNGKDVIHVIDSGNIINTFNVNPTYYDAGIKINQIEKNMYKSIVAMGKSNG